jgi:hypothetical protein
MHPGQLLFIIIHTFFYPIFLGMRGVQTLITFMIQNDDKSIGG